MIRFRSGISKKKSLEKAASNLKSHIDTLIPQGYTTRIDTPGGHQRIVISDPKKKERKNKPELYVTINEPEKVRLTYSPYVSGDHKTATYIGDFARDDKKIDACLKEIFSATQDDSGKINISDTLEKKFSLKKSVDKDRIDEKLVEDDATDYVHEPK